MSGEPSVGEGRSVLITGAGRGLGQALWGVYGGAGWRTFPVVRTERAAGELRRAGPNRCHPIVADLADDGAGARIEAVLSQHCEALDAAINNAGIAGRAARLAEVGTPELRALLEVHCFGALRVCQAAMPWLRRAPRPLIVNISSRLGSLSKGAAGEFEGRGFSYSYRIAKAAQNMLGACLAEEFSGAGITVLAVHPGAIRTALAAGDAELSARDAALRLYRWLEEQPPSPRCRYAEPFAGDLPW